MPSSEKTNYLKLNQWNGTDTPKRQDFVTDNLLIDQAVSSHVQNTDKHLTTADRVKLNNLFFAGSYIGNGTATRSFQLPEAPSFVILFPSTYPMGKVEFQGELHINNFGFCIQGGSGYGFSVLDKTLTVYHNANPDYTYEVQRFNQNGISYQYVAFR